MKTILRLAALGAALLMSGTAFAQQYPTKPVKIIVPAAPAGPTDIVARLIATKMTESLKQQFRAHVLHDSGRLWVY